MKVAREENVNNFIVTGDLNQDVEVEQIQRFMRENMLFEVHSKINETGNSQRDNTFNKGNK